MAPQAPPPDDDFEEGVPATPEEQAQLEDFVMAALVLIYEEKQVRPAIMDMLDDDMSDLNAVLGQTLAAIEEGEEQGADPPPPHLLAIAATAVMIVMQLNSMADAPLPDEIIFHGGKEIVEELVEISTKMGNEIGPDEANRAFLIATDLYREAAADAGLVDEAELAKQFEEIVAADKQGRLGEVLPALDQINQAAAVDAEAMAKEAPEEPAQ